MAEESIEKNFEALEKIVSSLESGELTVDQSLKSFRRGAELLNSLKKELKEVQNEIIEIKKTIDDSDERDSD